MLALREVPVPAGEVTDYSVHPGPLGEDEELIVRGRTVLCKAGGRVQRSYTLDQPVLKATYCYFAQVQGEKRERSLCILHARSLVVYSAGGERASHPLPCEVDGMWPLLEGLLLERRAVLGLSDGDGEGEGATLLTLLRPLEELKPVSAILGDAGEEQDGEQGEGTGRDKAEDDEEEDGEGEGELAVPRPVRMRMSEDGVVSAASAPLQRPRQEGPGLSELNDACERVVWTSADLPLLLTFNSRLGRHRLWVIRQSLREVARRLRAGSHAMPLEAGRARGQLRKAAWNAAAEDALEGEGEGEDDTGIYSELWLQPVWSECAGATASPASRVMLTSDWDGSKLLCLLSPSGTLTGLALSVRSLARGLISAKQAFAMEGVAAAAALQVNWTSDAPSSSASPACPFATELLVLSASRSLAVYAGSRRRCAVDMTIQPSSSSSSSSSSAGPLVDEDGFADAEDVLGIAPTPLDIIHPVADRITILAPPPSSQALQTQPQAQGKRWLRGRLVLSHACPLTALCMTALAETLPPALVFALRNDVIALRSPSPAASLAMHSSTAASVSADSEWAAFQHILTLFVREAARGSGSGGVSGRAAGSDPFSRRAPAASSSDPWQALLATPFHAQRAGGLAPASPSSSLSSSLGAAGLAVCSDPSFRRERAALVSTLHLVYEEVKLSTAAEASVGQMGALLAALVAPDAMNWTDHAHYYWLDGAHPPQHATAPAPAPAPAAAPPPLPSLFKHLHALLTQSASPYASSSSSSAAAAATAAVSPYPTLSCLRRSRALCAVFALIAGATPQPRPLPHHLPHPQAVPQRLPLLSPLQSPLRPSARPLLAPHASNLPSASTAAGDTPLLKPIATSPLRPRAGAGVGAGAGAHETPHPPVSRWRAGTGTRRAGRRSASASRLFSPTLHPAHQQQQQGSLAAPVGQALCERVVLCMVEEGLTAEDVRCLPFGLALPLLEAMRGCRDQAELLRWPLPALELIGRTDKARALGLIAVDPAPAHGTQNLTLPGAEGGHVYADAPAAADTPLLDAGPGQGQGGEGEEEGAGGDGDDGTRLLERTAEGRLRFGRDLRLREVCRLLSTTRLLRVSLPESRVQELQAQAQGGSADISGEQQRLLSRLAMRAMAAPVGRGALTFASASPMVTEALAVPRLELNGRIPPKDTLIELDPEETDLSPAGLAWAAFHNGVAAGLRVAPSQGAISRAWIVYNRPAGKPLDEGHAGFLLGLGLQGHLAALAPHDLYWYLTQSHKTTNAAVLLGVAAGKRASMDTGVTKLLCLHLSAMLPASALSEVDIPLSVQTAALLGLGLVYEGTAHRLTSEVLLGEIASRSAPKQAQVSMAIPPAGGDEGAEEEREAYALAAGLALGMVTLGRGAEAAGLGDLNLENRLGQLIDGKIAARPGTGAGPGLGASMAPPHTVIADVTAPAATVALGLMFMRTGSSAAAARLALPDSHYALDTIRPDLALLRVVCRSLVLWEGISASREWVESHLPAFIAQLVQPLMPHASAAASRTVPSASPYAAGEMLAEPPAVLADVDLAMDGTHALFDEDADVKMSFSAPSPSPDPSSLGATPAPAPGPEGVGSGDVDLASVRQTYLCIIAGACLALGLRYAGTCSPAACRTLSGYARALLHLRHKKQSGAGMVSLAGGLGGPSPLQRVDRPTLELCLSTVGSALAMVMAGSGHLETFRLLRALRIPVTARDDTGLGQSVFGFHLAAHTSIGLLFMGGGRYTLDNSPPAVAALLASLFPRLPLSPGDSRYHPQPLRHLYALAARQRAISARDADTGMPCYVPLQLTIRPMSATKRQQRGRTVKLIAPCLLPSIERILSIKVDSPRFFPLTIDFEARPELRALLGGGAAAAGTVGLSVSCLASGVLYVKRRPGHLPYAQDPLGLRSGTEAAQDRGVSPELIRTLIPDEALVAFVRHFPPGVESRECVRSGALGSGGSYRDILQSSLARGAVDSIPLRLALRHLLAMIERRQAQGLLCSSGAGGGGCEAVSLQTSLLSLRLAAAFYASRAARELCRPDSALLPPSLLDALRGRLDALLAAGPLPQHAGAPQQPAPLRAKLAEYIRTARPPQGQGQDAELVAAAITWLGLPSPSALAAGRGKLARLSAPSSSSFAPLPSPLLATAWPGTPLRALTLIEAALANRI